MIQGYSRSCVRGHYPDELEWLLIKLPAAAEAWGHKAAGPGERRLSRSQSYQAGAQPGNHAHGGHDRSHLGLPPEDVRKVRLAGLLHDLGHSALSHAVEGVLGRNPEIQPLMAGRRASRHEEFTREIMTAHPFGEEALRAG